jgi:hypothetical protein
MKKTLALCVFAILIFGCAQTSLYYWNGYSSSLYNYKKNPSEETIQKHKDSITTIINKADRYGKKVPPGLCCEYGYYLMLENNIIEAQQYFAMETSLYPESKKFVDLLLKQIQVNQGEIE